MWPVFLCILFLHFFQLFLGSIRRLNVCYANSNSSNDINNCNKKCQTTTVRV